MVAESPDDEITVRRSCASSTRLHVGDELVRFDLQNALLHYDADALRESCKEFLPDPMSQDAVDMAVSGEHTLRPKKLHVPERVYSFAILELQVQKY